MGNHRVVRQLGLEGYGQGNLAVIVSLLADSYIEHHPIPGQQPGRAGVVQQVRDLHYGFDEVSLEIHDIVCECDLVSVRWTLRGLHVADWMGVPATGRFVELGGIALHRVIDGQITESWTHLDLASLLHQLGLADRPGFPGEQAELSERERLVKRLYTKMRAGDADAVIAVLAPEIEWDTAQPDHGIPWLAARKGRDEVRRFFDSLSQLDQVRLRPLSFMEQGNNVAVVVQFEALVPQTDSFIFDTQVHVWTFDEDGWITGMQHFADTQAHLEALGLVEPVDAGGVT